MYKASVYISVYVYVYEYIYLHVHVHLCIHMLTKAKILQADIKSSNITFRSK